MLQESRKGQIDRKVSVNLYIHPCPILTVPYYRGTRKDALNRHFSTAHPGDEERWDQFRGRLPIPPRVTRPKPAEAKKPRLSVSEELEFPQTQQQDDLLLGDEQRTTGNDFGFPVLGFTPGQTPPLLSPLDLPPASLPGGTPLDLIYPPEVVAAGFVPPPSYTGFNFSYPAPQAQQTDLYPMQYARAPAQQMHATDPSVVYPFSFAPVSGQGFQGDYSSMYQRGLSMQGGYYSGNL